MRKYLRLCAVCLCIMSCLCLAACSGNSDENPESGGEDVNTGEQHEYEVTDVDFGDSQVHEELAKLDFEPGETVDNVYYKRGSDPETNEACYVVKRASDGEPAYLPLTKTVCYVDEMLSDRAYYERVPLNYILDGEQVETYQYQIFTSSFAVGDDGSRYAEAQGGLVSGNTDDAVDASAGGDGAAASQSEAETAVSEP